MSSECGLCKTKEPMFRCRECADVMCYDCKISRHRGESENLMHHLQSFCEECEDKVIATVFCDACEQRVCSSCDIKIHNKGKRKEHQRVAIEGEEVFMWISNCVFLTAEIYHNYCEDDIIEILTKLKNLFNLTNSTTLFFIIKDKGTDLMLNISKFKELFDFYNIIPSFDLTDIPEIDSEFIQDSRLKSQRTHFERIFILSSTPEPLVNFFGKIRADYFTDRVKIFHLNAVSSNSNGEYYMIDADYPEKKHMLVVPKPAVEPNEENIDLILKDLENDEVTKKAPNATIEGSDYNPLNKSFIDSLYSNTRNGGTNLSFDAKSLPADRSMDNIYPSGTNTSEIRYNRYLACFNNSYYREAPAANYTNTTQNTPFILNQPMKDVALDNSIKSSYALQNILRHLSDEGELLLTEPAIEALIVNEIAPPNPSEFLDKATKAAIVHITKRIFGNESHVFYSMKLDRLSVQCVGWVVRSIMKDHMTPTEKLILSRIKECFGLKINQRQWDTFVAMLVRASTSRPDHTNPNVNIIVRKEKDPLIDTETRVFLFKASSYKSEDLFPVAESEKSAYSVMLEFLEKYLDEGKTGKSVETNDTSPAQKKILKNIEGDTSGVKEEGIPGGRYGCAQFVKICGPEVLRHYSLGRLSVFVQEAINQGIIIYNRTHLVKNKNYGMLKMQYHKLGLTGGVGESTGTGAKSEMLLEEEKDKECTIQKIKKALLEVLAEYPDGVSLAQIPQNLKKKLNFQLNLQELGFPKLKNLLTACEEVVIHLGGTNHSYAILKRFDRNPPPSNGAPSHGHGSGHGPSGGDPQNELNNSTLNSSNQNKKQLFKNALNKSSYRDGTEAGGHLPQGPILAALPPQAAIHPHVVPTTGPPRSAHDHHRVQASDTVVVKPATGVHDRLKDGQPEDGNNYKKTKKVSSVDEYLGHVHSMIGTIVRENPYGVGLEQLFKILCNRLGFVFDFKVFNCQDFYEFLLNFAENLVDIEVKKTNSAYNNVHLYIYPKDFRFGKGTPGYSKQGGLPSPDHPNATPTKGEQGFFRQPSGVTPRLPDSKAGSTYSNNPNAGPVSSGARGQVPFMISPNALYHNSPQAHIRNVSYWNLNDGANNGAPLVSNPPGIGGNSAKNLPDGMMYNGDFGSTPAIHSRADSKVVRNGPFESESALDLKDQLRFLEELIPDNGENLSLKTFEYEKTNESSFNHGGMVPGFPEPDISLTNILGAVGAMDRAHNKTLSDDLSYKRTWLHYMNSNLAGQNPNYPGHPLNHLRGMSAVVPNQAPPEEHTPQ